MAVEPSLSSVVDNLSLDPESVTRVEFPRASHDGPPPPLDGSMAMPRPSGVGQFEFVVLASLRAAQLMRGCLPRVDGLHKHTVMAQLEVSQGKVMQELTAPVVGGAWAAGPALPDQKHTDSAAEEPRHQQ